MLRLSKCSVGHVVVFMLKACSVTVTIHVCSDVGERLFGHSQGVPAAWRMSLHYETSDAQRDQEYLAVRISRFCSLPAPLHASQASYLDLRSTPGSSSWLSILYCHRCITFHLQIWQQGCYSGRPHCVRPTPMPSGLVQHRSASQHCPGVQLHALDLPSLHFLPPPERYYQVVSALFEFADSFHPQQATGILSTVHQPGLCSGQLLWGRQHLYCALQALLHSFL